jgi:putative ABC transport system substrate-binding protein
MRRRKFIALVGAVVARPLSARAQQGSKVHRIAIAHPNPVALLTETGGAPIRALFTELRRLGYVEGRNLVIDRHSGSGVPRDGLGELAKDVVSQAPDLIVTVTWYMAEPLKRATNTIPIVAMVNDPVAGGFADSLARPGGNVTGVVVDPGMEVWEKRFQFLREVAPTASHVGFFVSRSAWQHPYGIAVREAAQKVGISLSMAEVEVPVHEPELRRAFAALRQRPVHALAFHEGPDMLAQRQLIAELAQELQVPTLYPFREFAELGGLITYSVDAVDLWRHAARQVDQILRGGKPAEIPFFRATKLELVINLKTAKVLGLTIPPTLLARADELIE